MSKQSSGVIIGQKGVHYGLQKVVPKKPGLTGAQTAPKKPGVTGAQLFGDDDSEEEDVERQIARQAEKKRAAAKVQQMYEDALAEDPSVFDYDGVYDSMQEARVAPKQQDKVQRQSKYIASLLDQAQQRKREQDVLYERRMVRERQQEDHLYEDKERFVTSAYRRKLEEDKKWQEAERQKELEEQRNDVRMVGHMGNFYANLLTKNVAYGTAAAKPETTTTATSAAAQQEDKQPQKSEGLKQAEAGGAGAEERAGGGGAAGPSAASREGSPSAGASGEEPSGPSRPAPSAKVLSQLDRYDILRLEAERALQKKRQQQQQRQPDGEADREGGQAQAGEAAPRMDTAATPLPAKAGQGKTDEMGRAASVGEGAAGARGAGVDARGAVAAGVGGEAEGADGGGTAQGTAGGGGKRRNDEGAVQSARERYLARKQQKTG